MDARVHLFGIRHHGPGSAASLVAALDALQPSAVLIEGPPEADGLIAYASAPGMRPPLALLAYAADDPALSAFFPFAVFSPEWQAMRWASRRDRPVRFIDWPAGMSLAAVRKHGEPAQDPGAGEAEELAVAEDPAMVPGHDGQVAGPPDGIAEPDTEDDLERDPLDLLAAISGHSDGEAFWNALVESRGAGTGVFAAVEAAMTALRAQMPSRRRGAPEARREARREAHMRLEIRRALKEHEGAIAVVCGAWHVPALRQKTAQADDRAVLKDAPRLKTEITWVPWTETRLAAASGYGAGVASPGWYGHLWSLYETGTAAVDAETFAATWQAKVAGLLRREGQAVSTASAIEAARLAVGLAAMRGHAAPGLEEMRDATLAALCHGDETPFRLIERRLIVGEAVGALDDSVPQMPLAADLAAWQRRLRLKPEALEQEISLDLRSEAGLAKSTLLHRLDLIGVSWGRLIDAGAGRGTFREIWRLAWAPELSVKLAEALVHGVTIAQAAAGTALARAERSGQIRELAELVRHCLMSDLPEAAERCIARLQAAAVNAVDVAALMRAVPPLVSVLRYGTARRMPLEALSALAKALAVEVNAGIVIACANLDDAAAEDMRQAMAGFDAALTLLGDDHLVDDWSRRLTALTASPAAAPLTAGLALRLGYDRAAIATDGVAATFSRALSAAVPPKAAGRWLEGFLGSNADVILHDPQLFGLIDTWLGERAEDDFVEVLPMLRRAFAGFGATERRRLLASVGRGPAPEAGGGAQEETSAAFAAALPLLLTILGLDTAEHEP